PRDSSADEWAFRIPRCVHRPLAVFDVPLSGTRSQTWTRWTRKNVSSVALICSGLGNSPSTGPYRCKALVEHAREPQSRLRQLLVDGVSRQSESPRTGVLERIAVLRCGDRALLQTPAPKATRGDGCRSPHKV